MTLGKTPLKSGRRKQPRILAQFPVEIRFKADGANFQIVQGVTSNLSEEGASCRLRQPIPADSVDPEEFWLHSNFITIKKTTVENFVNGYGKSAMVDLTIPRKLVERLNTTPEQMENDIFSGRCYVRLKRITAPMANAMNAIAIACRQDAALVANTNCANGTCEATKNGDLYFSAYFPSVFAATVGGGTCFGTARECLETLGNYGNGNSKRFAEIIAATAMAGEISLMTSIVNGTYIYAHETFARNRPPSKGERVAEGI